MASSRPCASTRTAVISTCRRTSRYRSRLTSPWSHAAVGLADERDERPQLQEPLLGLLVADVGGDAGRELRELLAEPGDGVGVQNPQGDAQPVVRWPERQGGEDVVDWVEAGADLIERGTERARQGYEVLPAPLRQATAPFLAASGEAGRDDLVEDVAVLGVGVDADAAVRVGPAGLELLEDANQGGGRPGGLLPRAGGPVGQAGAELRQAAVEVGEAIQAADFHEHRVEIVGLVVEERDGAIGVDAVDRECRLILLLAQLRILVLNSVERSFARTDSACAPDSWFSRRECSSSRAARTSLAARSRLSSSCLPVRCVLGAVEVDVGPLGGLHPLVRALEPVQLLRLLCRARVRGAGGRPARRRVRRSRL